MNTKQANLQKSSLFLLAASSIVLTGLPAQAINITLSPSQFTKLGTGGIVDNNASSTSNINITAPNDGFGDGTNGFFDSNFLLLGANPGDNITTDSNQDENSTARSTTFNLSTNDVAQAVQIKFQWAFQGNSLGIPDEDQDNFNIRLARIGGGSNVFFSKSAPTGYGGNKNEQHTFAADTLTAGDYRMTITLNENADTGTSSAAGFNQISVQNVPFEFSPSTGLLMVGGFLGFTYLKKRRQVALSVDFENNCGEENQS
jgi:hypothetical protein